MTVPKIVFCTTCKNRTQHLKEALPRNIKDNVLANSHFVVVNYNSKDDMDQYIRRNHRQDIRAGKMSYYKYRGEHSFRMAHAKNMAHRLGIAEGADILVNLDADNLTGAGFDKYIMDTMVGGHTFLWANMIKGVLPKGISGRIIVTRDQFLLSGGYDEKYETYSPDDKDFKARLIRMEFDPLEIDPKYLNCIKHNDRIRFMEYPHAANADAEEFAIHPSNRVVNYGRIGLGRVTRNFAWCSTTVEAIPTRVFGVGLHKTATTSLHHAFQILGMQAGHWKNAHWAKAIYKQMTGEGRSLTVEKAYALCDLPIPVLFKELDIAYPNSKFVLTTRNEGDWLESVKKHWDPKYNPQKPFWNKDPFTHIIHRVVYGQKGYDREIMLARYRRHNAEVRGYFADRPDDLFELDMSKPVSWGPLCKFLGSPVPSQPYPIKNTTPTFLPWHQPRACFLGSILRRLK